MIIHLHSCPGKFDFKISKKIVDNYENNPNDIKALSETDEYGRSKYLIDYLKNKHIYLSIKSAKLPQGCNSRKEKDSNNIECSKELSYLIFYYSLTDQEYSSKKHDLKIIYRYLLKSEAKVNIKFMPLEGRDKYNNKRE